MTDGMERDVKSFQDARSRVMTMAIESCADETCPIQSELERCVDQALQSR